MSLVIACLWLVATPSITPIVFSLLSLHWSTALITGLPFSCFLARKLDLDEIWAGGLHFGTALLPEEKTWWDLKTLYDLYLSE